MSHSIVHYDSLQRRLWIRGQRCHHGATGALLAGAGMIGLATLRAPALTAMIAAGSVLMAHDWHDRRLWFAKGWQEP
jgi:threonine dehydrogenase-like Zn-dependent dehydrogenase